MFGKLLKSRNGNFGIMAAFTLPVALGAAAVAVDLVHIRQVKTELQNATDAAVLAVARKSYTEEERKELFRKLLRSSLQTSGAYSLLSSDVRIKEGLNSIEVTGEATARVDTLMLGRAEEQIVRVLAAAAQSTRKVELTMVLDNTGSMGQAGIDTLKEAALGLLGTVEEAGKGKDVKVALVPFVTAVNVRGEGFDETWIDTDGQALYNGWTFLDKEERKRRGEGETTNWEEDYGQACENQGQSAVAQDFKAACERLAESEIDYPEHDILFAASGTVWKGCVEARPFPYNLDLTPPDPDNPDTLFVPYFAPDEPGESTFNGGNEGKNFNNSWLNDLVSGSKEEKQRSILKYLAPATKAVEEGKSLSRGPNRSCPTPIVPLTAELQKVRDGINIMRYWNGSGTNIAEGLAWGWRVITPEAPYTEAASHDPENVSKFVVLMSDGRNVSFGSSGTVNKSDYGSYGFLADKRISGTTSQSAAEKQLNAWTLEMCTRMKGQGIELFTVLYKETDKAVQKLFKDCASKATNFHMASDTGELKAAFADIGSDMTPLRLVR